MFTALLALLQGASSDKDPLPAFGRDTVLVWKIQNQNSEADFVVRIAEFSPDRFLEWEDGFTQGTIFMPNRDIVEAKGYVGSNLFESGVDKRSKNVTTLWLSQKMYRDLKERQKVKCVLDGVACSLMHQGDGRLTVEVNRSPKELSVIKVLDDRGSERWFLDQEENPLMVKHLVRKFNQTLTSITTNRANTLRWIKGKKLTNLPR
jgi:hypothetical protein